jgi:hypothetical protein
MKRGENSSTSSRPVLPAPASTHQSVDSEKSPESLRQPGIIFSGLKKKLTSEELLSQIDKDSKEV